MHRALVIAVDAIHCIVASLCMTHADPLFHCVKDVQIGIYTSESMGTPGQSGVKAERTWLQLMCCKQVLVFQDWVELS